MSVSDTFDLIVRASFLLSAAMVLLLLATLIVVRTRTALYFHHRNLVTERWRNVFTTAYEGAQPPQQLPPIRKGDWFTVLGLFVALHGTRENLDALARRAGIDDYALALLQRGDEADKVLAFKTLGHLRDHRALELAKRLAQDKGPELSRAAAHCALRIEPAFISGVLELLLDRDDWARSRVELMLGEVGQDVLGVAMLNAIAGAPDNTKARLLDYVRLCSPTMARKICTRVLAEASDPEVLAATLRSLAPLASEGDRDVAIRYSASSSSIVALSALRVLRKCVRESDRDLLVAMMSHTDYWVRLRAAEAAVQLFGQTPDVEAFASTLTDPYARDAIKQVLSERAMVEHRTPKPYQHTVPSKVTAA
jgi:HEAT repeat protein